MKRIALTCLAAATLALPGCVIVADSSGSKFDGYGTVTRTELDQIVASNTQNRIGEDQTSVLARYPANNVSLLHSSINQHGEEVTVYRVYARTHYRSTRFERFLVFENGYLALLTDDRDDIEVVTGVED